MKNLPLYTDVISQMHCEARINLPAELHGFMCGILCGQTDSHSHLGFKTVLDRLSEENVMTDEAKSSAATLMLLSVQQLQESDFSFQLLLPSDEMSIQDRAEALSVWCQGFLSGLGLAQLPEKLMEQTAIKEILQDVAEIAKTTYSHELPGEEAEYAYLELVEFVRMAILLVYMQCVIERGESTNKESRMH